MLLRAFGAEETEAGPILYVEVRLQHTCIHFPGPCLLLHGDLSSLAALISGRVSVKACLFSVS